jgi:tetratricopeptide (TPR) repeat protein
MDLLKRFLTWLAPTRLYMAAFAMIGLAGLSFCFLPLVNLLGYESAAAFGVIAGIAAVFLTLHAFACEVVATPLAAERRTSPTADFFVVLVRHELMLVLPAVFLSLNATRVINCAPGTGFGFWLAIAVPAVFLGQALAWFVAAVVSENGRLQLGLCLAAIVASVVTLVAHLALEPPIIGHQLFLGYFSGSIYDEALALPASLLWYRAMHIAVAAAGLAAIEALWRRRQERPARWITMVVLVALAGGATMWWHRHDLGIGIDRGYIEAQLGGRIETDHFVIHFAQTEAFLKNQKRLAEDHEYRYAEMVEFFDTDPAKDGKIHSYVYPDREVKGRLMGGRRTLVAKLWLHEMHITWRYYGDHKLTHELAHIFTEPFGAGPLRLSMQAYIGVNMGLVEGAAAAAEWPSDELSPHRASAALRRLDLAPDIRAIVGASGFWSQSSGRAYTLVGSFVRFLIDEHGIETFKKAYPSGDFAGAYGRPTDELVAEWETFLGTLELSDGQMELARYLFDRASIFDKVCAREIGEMKRVAGIAATEGNVGQVRETYETILDFAPLNINHRIAYAQALMQARQDERAVEQVDEMLEGDHPPAVRARLLHLRGDLAWRNDDTEQAQAAYRQCLGLGVPYNARRLLEVKLGALARSEGAGRKLAFDYLLGQVPATVSLYLPMKWHQMHTDDALAAYLVGRRLWAEQQWQRALPYLKQATNLDQATNLEMDRAAASQGVLVHEARRMLGRSYYFLGQLEHAREVFDTLATSTHPSYRASAREWLDRIAWRRGNRIGTH